VNLVRRLRGSALRLAAARLPESDRKQLLDLVHTAIARHEGLMRDGFRPQLLASFNESGLSPRNCAERTARDKTIEELLDRVVDRGFLTMADLRDALARNRLKLADLSGLREFFLGDALLRANTKLSLALDGVYRRGEAYLRGLHQLSSLAFGTRLGRFLTLYLILPFLGAFVILEGLQHVIHWIARVVAPPSPPVELVNEFSLPPTGIFLLLVFHVSWFRRCVFAVFRLLWRIVRGLLYDLPLGFMGLPLVRAVFQSRSYLLFYLLVLKPLMWSALLALPLYFLGVDLVVVAIAAAIAFLAAEALLQSRLGMRIEELASDVALRGWRTFSRDLIPGLFRLVMAFFRRLVDDLEGGLYTVDEWLRFRKGDSRGWLTAKALLGVAWFLIAYVVRFCVNLLIEPQINPIKHFPVVTVSHKLIFAFLVTPLTPILFRSMDPIMAGLLLFVVQFGLPGIPGFLVWEFKENWRLFRANQPRDLRPQIVGSHGETVPRLLRPGFHSGTLPKLYARLRRFKGAGRGKPHEELHHVEEAVRRFVERHLLAMLARSKAWGEAPLQVGRVHLASNRIRIELLRRARDEAGVFIDLEEHVGWLVAGIASARSRDAANGAHPANGWLDRLPLGQVRAFADALAGFYKAAGVDLVREQVEALTPAGAWCTFDDRGLVVELPPTFEHGAAYDLKSEGALTPRPLRGDGAAHFRKLPADKLLFRRTPIRWDEWAEAWERDQAGKGHRPPLARGVQLLPLGTAKGRWAARRRK
jgi:hypothetical protein